MAKVLILGGCGYVGSRLCQYLPPIHKVDSIDLEWRGNPGGFPNWKTDYRSLVSTDYEPYDAVILLAAHSTVKACAEAPRPAFENNFAGFVRLCGKLRPDQKLIYASSAVVAAKAGNPTVYDLSKQWMEEWATSQFPNSWGLRFGTVCGPSPNMIFNTMLNGMVQSALTKNLIEMTNPGIHRPLLGIHDLCKAVGLIVAGSVKPGLHNLVSVNTTVADLADQVSFQTGASIVTRPASQTYDFTMQPAPWFVPQQEIEDMVATTVDALKQKAAA